MFKKIVLGSLPLAAIFMAHGAIAMSSPPAKPNVVVTENADTVVDVGESDAVATSTDRQDNLSSVFLDAGISPRFIYINTEYGASDSRIAEIKQAIDDGQIIMIDNTELSDLNKASALTLDIAGVGLKNPVVFVYKESNKLTFDTVEVDETQGRVDYSDIMSSDEVKRNVVAATLEIQEKLLPTLVSSRSANQSAVARSSIITVDQPNQYTFYVNAKRYGFSCMTPGLRYNAAKARSEFSNHEKPFDPCSAKSNANLRYTIDLIRSDQVGSTPAAKYVRVSILPQNGGEGISITPQLREHKFSGLHTVLTPFVNKYKFNVASSDEGIEIAGHTPQQVNPKTVVTNTTGIQVGVSANAGVGGLGGSSPTGSLGVTGSFSYTNSRSMQTESFEYTVENHTGFQPRTAAWVWDRKYNENRCDWLQSRDFGTACHFSGPLWQKGAFNLRAFSAISYANFVPGFSATFVAPNDKQGTSDFNVNSTLKINSLLATSYYPLLARVTSLTDRVSSNVELNTSFSVDWESGVFKAAESE